MNCDETKTGLAEVNGTKLYYETRGQGPPIVFIHGGLLNSREWDKPFMAFAEHQRAIRFDAPGAGKLLGHDTSYAAPDDIIELARFLGIETENVVI